MLAPRDFALAKGLFEAGDADRDRAGRGRRRVRARPADGDPRARAARVEDSRRPAPASKAARESASSNLTRGGERLDSLSERLLELPRESGALPLAELGELEDLVAVASRPNWDYLREQLRRIDEQVAAAAVDALTPEQEAELKEETRAAERQRARVDAASLDQAVGRLVRQRARERLKIPRVGLV